MLHEILEDKGSKKRYKLRIKKPVFLGSPRFFDVTLLSTKEIEPKHLKKIASKLAENITKWVKSGLDKKERQKYKTVLPAFPDAKFYITEIKKPKENG